MERKRQDRAGKERASQGALSAQYLQEFSRGERLLAVGQTSEAVKVFNTILTSLAAAPRFEWAAVLGRLAYCAHLQGKPDLVIARLQDATGVAAQLRPSGDVGELQCMLYIQLGNALCSAGRLIEGKGAYDAALAIAQRLNDLRSQGIVEGQLGAVAWAQGTFEEALTRHRTALALFQRIREPALEALSRHQLGQILHQRREWDEAERHYSDAARLREAATDLAGAAQLWDQLALLCQQAGWLERAEAWRRKTID